jgi:hypothetical protein
MQELQLLKIPQLEPKAWENIIQGYNGNVLCNKGCLPKYDRKTNWHIINIFINRWIKWQ